MHAFHLHEGFIELHAYECVNVYRFIRRGPEVGAFRFEGHTAPCGLLDIRAVLDAPVPEYGFDENIYENSYESSGVLC